MSDTPNPPAFPCENIIERNAKGHLIGHEISGAGLTMRDYFAARAMERLMDMNEWRCIIGTEGAPFSDSDIAEMAYEQADAMLAARGGDK